MTNVLSYFLFCLLVRLLPTTAPVTPDIAISNVTTPDQSRPVNYVVLIDLSDRLLQPDQARRDITLVQAVFDQFEKGVRRQLIISSNDRFRVVIAPQKGISYNPEQFMNTLYLDMSTLPIARKRQQLDALSGSLTQQLTRLYATAVAGRRQPRDFAGSDLWQYANEQLSTDLDPAYDNRLVIVTDGYFDFERNTHRLVRGNRATDSQVMDRLRKDPHWRQTLALPTEGLLPVPRRLPPMSVYVAEIQPKYDRLDEAELLTAVWTKWLTELQTLRRDCQLRGSLPKSLASLNRFLVR